MPGAGEGVDAILGESGMVITSWRIRRRVPYLRLARPGNAVMSGMGVAIAALVAGGPALVVVRFLSVAFAAVAAFLFTAAGNALNDYFDRETDRTNHPDRPIPRGEISPEEALRFASLAFALSLVAALLAVARPAGSRPPDA